MPQEKMVIQPHTTKSFVAELATYASLLTPLLGAYLAWRGLNGPNYFFVFYGVLPLVPGTAWLIAQYRLAKIKIRKEGVVPRPAWFWKLVTNKVPHKSEQLSESQVMVFVPPGKEAEALILEQEYNRGGKHILLFHHIPEPTNGVIDEDQGRIAFNGEVRSLETLTAEMNECAALVLLDDTKWENYERTTKLIEEWTKRHTVRPVMSVHLDGRGTLNYSWNHFEELVEPNRSLKNRLLAQSANRGANWFWQARLYRRMILWISAFVLVGSLFTFFTESRWRRNSRNSQNDATTEVSKQTTEVKKLQKITSSDPSAQQEIARAFERYRTDTGVAEGDRLRLLLHANADQIRTTLAKASNESEAMSGSVMMFSVQEIPSHSPIGNDPVTTSAESAEQKANGPREFEIHEVAATRIPPNDKFFTVRVEGRNNNSTIDSIIGCAVVSRAFILWSGEWKENDVNTTDIKAWNLAGGLIGSFYQQRITINNNRCGYQKRATEDLHRRMLCGPVGMDPNSNNMVPAGAICVSYPQDVKFLEEDWVRQTIARYGTSLSFTPWEKAVHTANPKTAPTSINTRSIARRIKKTRTPTRGRKKGTPTRTRRR